MTLKNKEDRDEDLYTYIKYFTSKPIMTLKNQKERDVENIIKRNKFMKLNSSVEPI